MKHGLLIDMDGVIYSGETFIEGADTFILHLLKKCFGLLHGLVIVKVTSPVCPSAPS